jgi:hypothetical protein
VWLDEAELNVGDSLIDRISDTIAKIDLVAAIISSNSVASPWVRKELALAMSKEVEGKRIVVLPVLIEKCPLPAFLNDKLYADFTCPQEFDRQFSRLLRAIDTHGSREPVQSTSGAAKRSAREAQETIIAIDTLLQIIRHIKPKPEKEPDKVRFAAASIYRDRPERIKMVDDTIRTAPRSARKKLLQVIRPLETLDMYPLGSEVEDTFDTMIGSLQRLRSVYE